MIKTKDLIIRHLYNALETTDTDHRRLQEAHIQIIDRIIGNLLYKLYAKYKHIQLNILILSYII